MTDNIIQSIVDAMHEAHEWIEIEHSVENGWRDEWAVRDWSTPRNLALPWKSFLIEAEAKAYAAQREGKFLAIVALQAIKDAGYCVVPTKPSEEMMKAGLDTVDGYYGADIETVYRVMIQAAQEKT